MKTLINSNKQIFKYVGIFSILALGVSSCTTTQTAGGYEDDGIYYSKRDRAVYDAQQRKIDSLERIVAEQNQARYNQYAQQENNNQQYQAPTVGGNYFDENGNGPENYSDSNNPNVITTNGSRIIIERDDKYTFGDDDGVTININNWGYNGWGYGYPYYSSYHRPWYGGSSWGLGWNSWGGWYGSFSWGWGSSWGHNSWYDSWYNPWYGGYYGPSYGYGYYGGYYPYYGYSYYRRPYYNYGNARPSYSYRGDTNRMGYQGTYRGQYGSYTQPQYRNTNGNRNGVNGNQPQYRGTTNGTTPQYRGATNGTIPQYRGTTNGTTPQYRSTTPSTNGGTTTPQYRSTTPNTNGGTTPQYRSTTPSTNGGTPQYRSTNPSPSYRSSTPSSSSSPSYRSSGGSSSGSSSSGRSSGSSSGYRR